MQVSKLGDSLAVRIPASVAEELDLQEGDEVELHVTAKKKVESEDREQVVREALASIRRLRRPFQPDYKFDREELHER